MFTTWNLLKMTHKQFKKANSLILSVLTTMLFLLLLLMAVGCVSEREIVYRSVYFADTNGVTTIYYPESMEKDDESHQKLPESWLPDDLPGTGRRGRKHVKTL